MQALAGRMQGSDGIRFSPGSCITYNGVDVASGTFVPQRTAAYVDQACSHGGVLLLHILSC